MTNQMTSVNVKSASTQSVVSALQIACFNTNHNTMRSKGGETLSLIRDEGNVTTPHFSFCCIQQRGGQAFSESIAVTQGSISGGVQKWDGNGTSPDSSDYRLRLRRRETCRVVRKGVIVAPSPIDLQLRSLRENE